VEQVEIDRATELASIASLLRERQDDCRPSTTRGTSDFTVDSELRLLSDQKAFMTVSRKGDTVLGVVSWTPLPWDSEQLGMSAARIDVLASSGSYREARERKSAMIRALIEECRANGIRYLTTRVPSEDLSSINALSSEGFDLMDGILTFSIRLDSVASPPSASANGFEVRLFQHRDLDQLLAIASSGYACDRFHVDRALAPGVADRLFAAWVARSCSGEEADAVVVAAAGSRVLAYVTCKLGAAGPAQPAEPTGRIVLVATAKEARGRGIASAVLQGALDWFRIQGTKVVEVGTQLQNVVACRLYEQNGFRMARTSLTFRRML
jgi:GNAT superfamily N-acetyltransferase